MIVRTVYSYSTEKAKQRKPGKEIVGLQPALLCGFLDVNYAFARLLHASVCLYMHLCCVYMSVCVHMFEEMLGRDAR